MAKRPPSDLVPVRRLVGDSLDQGFLGLAKDMVRVFQVWTTAVGEYNASKAWPETIHSGCLTVLVESPAWIDHFSYFKSEFIHKVNQALGGSMVTDIRFKVGKRPEPVSASVEKTTARPPAPDSTAKPVRLATTAVDVVKDEELRENLARLLAGQRRPPTE